MTIKQYWEYDDPRKVLQRKRGGKWLFCAGCANNVKEKLFDSRQYKYSCALGIDQKGGMMGKDTCKWWIRGKGLNRQSTARAKPKDG